MDVRTSIYLVIQVVVGLIIVYLVYRTSLWISKQDKMVIDQRYDKNVKQQLAIINGYALSSMLSNRAWTTMNPYASNYAPIMKSFNRRGGAQFTYSFWMQLEDTDPSNVAHRDILLRGDIREYSYTEKVVKHDIALSTVTRQQERKGVLVKMPKISFGHNAETLVVEFNTLHNMNERFTITSNQAAHGENTVRKNLMKLGSNRWTMYTFTFQDNVAINDFEDGIIVSFYVNDVLYGTKKIASTLKLNNGNLYIMPSAGAAPIRGAKIGHVKYFNYALSNAMVSNLFKEGHPKFLAKDVMGREGAGDPLYLSEYNRLDVYNT